MMAGGYAAGWDGEIFLVTVQRNDSKGQERKEKYQLIKSDSSYFKYEEIWCWELGAYKFLGVITGVSYTRALVIQESES